MEGDLHGIDILASCYITTLIWMSQKVHVVCWRAGFSTVPAVFLVVLKPGVAHNEDVTIGPHALLSWLSTVHGVKNSELI